MAIDYLALFGDDFDTVLGALDGLTPEAEKVLLNSLDRMVYDSTIFSNNIQKQVGTMTANGMSQSAIKEVLNTDMKTGGRIFGELQNNVKAGITDGVNQSARLGQYQNYDLDKGLFAWVTVGGHKVCMDCDGRQGVALTWAEWESEGVPGSGWSVCRAFCYCILDPTGKLPKRVEGVPVKEKSYSKRGRPKFKKITKVEADRLAMKFINMAKLADDEITALTRRLADENGVGLHGLKYRVKTPKSASRKIIKDSIEDRVGYNKMLKEDLGDLNRYTYLLDSDDYYNQYTRIIKGFQDEGYEVLKVKNYWEGDLYKGMNVNMRNPIDGRKIEFQFNTERQQFFKDEWSHKWYEEFREVTTPAARKNQLEQMLTDKWIEFENLHGLPKGQENIPFFP
tara:strand:- start:1769 stop:2953 length:1185 start_codon:yes stop_codon:yes gene_type:complete